MNFSFLKATLSKNIYQQRFGTSKDPFELVVRWGYDMTWMKGKDILECDDQSFVLPSKVCVLPMPSYKSRCHMPFQNSFELTKIAWCLHDSSMHLGLQTSSSFHHMGFTACLEFSRNNSKAMGPIELMACCGRLFSRVEVWFERRANNNWLELTKRYEFFLNLIVVGTYTMAFINSHSWKLWTMPTWPLCSIAYHTFWKF